MSRAKEDISESDLLRFVEGDCSPDEAAAVQAWIVADPRRGELLDELRVVWRLTGSTTRSWAVAETRFRLLRTRGRHAVQRSAGLPRRSRAGVWALRFAAAVATLEPLLVLDDMPVAAGSLSSGLAGIAPRDVGRIDVLKDAGASIYGSRGGNGVIIITTKRATRQAP